MLIRCWLLAVALALITKANAAAPPVPVPDAAEILALIGRLGDDDPDRRRDAAERLVGTGEPALAALRRAAAGDGDADVRLRAAVTARAATEVLYGAEVRRFDPSKSLVQGVAFLRDGRVLSGHDDACLRLWDAETGKELLCLRGHVGRVLGVAASPDGKRALTAGEDKTVRLWDLAAGKELRQFTGHGDWVIHVAFSPDGKHALSCSGGHWDGWWKKGADQTARLWDVETGKEVRRFTGHDGVIFQTAFLPGGRWAVTSSGDRTARVWEVATGKEVHRLVGHEDGVRCAVASPDARRVVSGSLDGTLRVWDVGTGEAVRTIKSDTTFHATAMTADGKRLLTLAWYGKSPGLRLWDLGAGRELHRFVFDDGWPTSVAISADGRRAVSGDSKGLVRLWRLGR